MVKSVRAVLDGIYFGAGVLAAVCLVVILVLIVLQMLARWTGEMFPGAPEYAGYAMAAASFLAFAHALNRGAHIRVSLLLTTLGPRARRLAEIWCFANGAALAWYLVHHGVRFVYWSYRFGDVSQGPDATPLWIPQSVMVLGAFVFALALSDHLLALLTEGRHRLSAETVDDGRKA